MKRRSNAAKSIFTVVLILLLLAVAAVIAKLSNGFTSDVKTFYVKVNGKTFTDTGEFRLDKDTEIEVVSLADKVSGKPVDYEYRIVPCGEGNKAVSVFYVDGVSRVLTDVKDYTNCFEVSKTDKGISIKTITLNKVLSKAFGGNVVELPKAMNDEANFFTLVVTSRDRSVTVNFGLPVFHPTEGSPTGINLDVTEVTF